VVRSSGSIRNQVSGRDEGEVIGQMA
jgi:hypothetical protein